jgi:hypothetical protein
VTAPGIGPQPGFGPANTIHRPKPPGIPRKPTVSPARPLLRMPCKSSSFRPDRLKAENRGVPGSNPGLAMGLEPACRRGSKPLAHHRARLCGNLLEVVILVTLEGTQLAIHAMHTHQVHEIDRAVSIGRVHGHTRSGADYRRGDRGASGRGRGRLRRRRAAGPQGKRGRPALGTASASVESIRLGPSCATISSSAQRPRAPRPPCDINLGLDDSCGQESRLVVARGYVVAPGESTGRPAAAARSASSPS